MVWITLKRAEEPQFLYEAPATTPVASLIPAIADLYNLRLRLKRLVDAGRDLIEYGPIKPESEYGYTEEQLDSLGKEKMVEKKEVEINGRKVLMNPDPTGRRTGEAPTQDLADILRKTLDNAEACLSADLVKLNKCLTKDILEEAFANVQGAVMIAFPMNIPEWDPVREALEDKEDLSGTQASKDIIPAGEASLWWAGKELLPPHPLSHYTGTNNKTKIIAKLQKRGQGPPLREPPVSEQQQKEMMAYYYRKQEQQKKLMENDEDEYLHSPWANPKSLKSAFTGIGDVSWRPR
ncbi:hypothetical protein BC832DRAFT_306145 [Gaertneriomyces semiglobifer]|nr:hypothetical protein BC832DRAFT_306145 [Gaertneriomyces semiglobifer]